MKKILIIGGDNRMKAAAEILKQDFYVDTLGLFKKDNGKISESDIILLPVPTTKDGETVFTPNTERKIYLKDIEKEAEERLILTLNYNFSNKSFVDYGKEDSFAILNAVPTAEGAIALAIENTDFTLWGSKVLIIGFGRCGKILADRLKVLGAVVYVSARKDADFAMINSLGFHSLNTNELNLYPLDFDIIFNTVDVKVIDDKSLKNTSAKLMIELASKEGFSLSAAESYGIKAIKASGLPGKYAPNTAGKIIAETVKKIILRGDYI